MHPAALDEAALLKQCDIGKGRASGPGGQHRNKVETLVMLKHRPTGVEAHAGERRSAEENKWVAIFRLRLALAIKVRQAVPIGDARSDLWKSRTRDGRIACNPEHPDYPALVAEALDMIEACDLDPGKAAIRLEVTTSQLIKLVKDHPPAMVWWNGRRRENGEHTLH